MGSRIAAIEYHFPEEELTNENLGALFPDYDFSKFEEKVGIRTRYIAAEGETALDLAQHACEKLLKRFDRHSIDFLLFCTQSPDYIMPTTACILQDRLGLATSVGALDISLGCSGFAYGLSMAKALINTGQAKNVLLVTADTYSRYMNPGDRSNRSIFGDGATASLVCWSEEECIGNFRFGSDGGGYDKLIIRNGGSRYPVEQNPEIIDYGTDNCYTNNDFYMNGPEVLNFTTKTIPPFTEDILSVNGLEKESVGQFIFHQANAFMLKLMQKKLKIDSANFYIDLAEGGNTVSSTIPTALKKYSASRSSTGTENVVIVGFGIGLSWCGGLVKINEKL